MCATPHEQYDADDKESAEAAYREAIRLDPGIATYHDDLGDVLYDQERYAEAEAAYREAIRLDPGDPVYHDDLGRALYDQERYEEAEAAQREAVRLNPEHPGFLFNLGTDLHAQGRYAEAEAAYREAIRLDPDEPGNALFYEALGAALSGQDKYAGAYMDDDWRVCIEWGDLRELMSEQALARELSGRLGLRVKVSRGNGQIFWYASSAGSADETAQVARGVIARHDVSAPVRTERWNRRDQEWRDVTDEPSADIAAELQAAHEYFQEQERERSRRAGFPAWQVRVEVPSHRDVVALAGYLAAQGWRVRRRRRHLLVGADCEDDAKGLVRELSGDGRADAETAFRVGRIRYSYMLYDAVDNSGSG